ncbi:MAG TPA: Uma2 family endonuclease [Gemmata sp.]|jgi:Uma2 family endonuclease|nr:Uma2 family endonuclease [Gemmata sp.]
MATVIAETKTALEPSESFADIVERLESSESFADIAERLGDISPDRIIWLPRPATEEDVVRLCEKKRLVELIDGFLVEKAMGFRESLLAALVINYLINFTKPRKLGMVGAPDAIMRLRPGQVRLPDVSFVTWERLLATNAHTKKVAPLGPDLAVEILSEGNTRKEIDRKRHELFEAGTKLIWVIDPKTRTAEVYDDPAQPDKMIPIGEAGALDGGTVLPGFRLLLSELFADLDPPAPPTGT